MKKITALLTLIAILFLTTVNAGAFAQAEYPTYIPTLAMPIEHINYTITEKNGTLWATIDGEYPITIKNAQNPTSLPMLYPMPPNSTNITVNLNGNDVPWINYTQTRPEAMHKTALGKWRQISCWLENISDNFNLKIHYEHPLETLNEKYVFLYDLNIDEYLSVDSPQSVAYFMVRFVTNIENLLVYTAPPNSSQDSWYPKEFILTQEGLFYILNTQMISNYTTVLPGDLVFTFSKENQSRNSDTEQIGSLSIRIISILLGALLVSIVLYLKRKKSSLNSSRETTIRSYDPFAMFIALYLGCLALASSAVPRFR